MRRNVVAFVLLGLFLAATIPSSRFWSQDDSSESSLVTMTTLTVIDRVSAGQVVTIVGTSAESAGVGEVLVDTAFGRLRFDMLMTGGHGQIDLPVAVTQHASVISIAAGDVVETLTVEPGGVDELIAPLVGPRTIVADGRDESLAVLLPVDRFGNQVADGTAAEVEWQQPNEVPGEHVSTRIRLDTEDGMAWMLAESGTTAGPATIRATATSSSGDVVHAAPVRIDEVPGRVGEIELLSRSDEGIADGRSLTTLESGTLTDDFGNELLDGTIAHLHFDGPSGRGSVAGTVQNGVVHLDLVAPDRPGTVTARLQVHDSVSADVEIEFGSAIAHFDAHLHSIGSDLVLRIENALDNDDAFVPDGTEVVWGEQRAQLRFGAAEIRVPKAAVPEQPQPVEVLGLVVQPGESS